jgi:hypothetical protein
MVFGRYAAPLALLAAMGTTEAACGLSTAGLQSGEASDAGTDVTTTGYDGGSPPPPYGDDSAALDSSGSGAAPDTGSPPADAGCAGGMMLCPGGGCMPDCTQCTGAPLSCRTTNTCVADCMSSCGSLPIGCFVCDLSGAGNPHGSCEANDPGGFCLSGQPSFSMGPYASLGLTHHCPCNQGPCLAPNEVCDPQIRRCLACGENNTDNQHCANGDTCHAAMAACQP